MKTVTQYANAAITALATSYCSIVLFFLLIDYFTSLVPPNTVAPPAAAVGWHCPDQPDGVDCYCENEQHPHYHLSTNTATEHWENPPEDGGHTGIGARWN